MTQTLNHRKAIQKYCDVQRSARSEFRANAKVIEFRCPPGTPNSKPQTLSRLDTRRFWVGMAVLIGVVAGLRVGGVL